RQRSFVASLPGIGACLLAHLFEAFAAVVEERFQLAVERAAHRIKLFLAALADRRQMGGEYLELVLLQISDIRHLLEHRIVEALQVAGHLLTQAARLVASFLSIASNLSRKSSLGSLLPFVDAFKPAVQR